jgi:hypothetical protein
MLAIANVSRFIMAGVPAFQTTQNLNPPHPRALLLRMRRERPLIIVGHRSGFPAAGREPFSGHS